MVVKVGSPHTTHAGFAHAWRTAGTHVGRGRHRTAAVGTTRHVLGGLVRRGSLHRLAIVNLGHPAHSPAAESRILVGVAPAIHGALDESTLPAQARVQLRQCPSHGIALGLVHQAVTPILVFAAARTGVDAVLRLELGAEGIHAHGLDVTSNGVFHLDAVARILKRNPLHPVVILPDHQRRRCRDGAGGRVGVDPPGTSSRNVILLHLRAVGHMLLRT